MKLINRNKNKNKKGLVFTILGAFTLVGMMYCFMIFLDLFNIMYTQVVFQGDVRSSALHAANYVDLDKVDNGQYNSIVIKSDHGTVYDPKTTAEYNAQRVFGANFQKHYTFVKDANKNDFVKTPFNAYNPKLKVKVYNLSQKPNGEYNPVMEDMPGVGTRYKVKHSEPGVAVYVELPIKAWTIFFKSYKIHAYSYASPILTK